MRRWKATESNVAIFPRESSWEAGGLGFFMLWWVGREGGGGEW